MKAVFIFYLIAAVQALSFSQVHLPSHLEIKNSILTIGHFSPSSCGYVNSELPTRGLHDDNELIQVMDSLNAHDIGTGFIYELNGDRYVITCEHVILNSDSIVGYNSSYQAFNLVLVGGDTFYDIAVLKFKEPSDANSWEGLHFDFTPENDSGVFAIGYWHWSGIPNINQGRLIDDNPGFIERDFMTAKMGFLKSNAATDSGYSGGVLLNLEGQVIGMNSFINVRDSSSFALTSSIIERIVKDIIIENNKELQRPFLGIQFAQTVEGAGVMINDVLNNCPASKLKDQIIGKRLTRIDTNPITDIYDVLQIMEESVSPNKPVVLKLTDNNRTFSVKIIPQKLTDIFHEEIAHHAIDYNEEDQCESVLTENGRVSILSNYNQREFVMTAGLQANRVYCIPHLAQLGKIVRIFSLHGELKIGTDDQFLKGRYIWFSQEANVRVLYY